MIFRHASIPLPKTNMELKNEGLEDDVPFPFHFGVMFRFQPLVFGGCIDSSR